MHNASSRTGADGAGNTDRSGGGGGGGGGGGPGPRPSVGAGGSPGLIGGTNNSSSNNNSTRCRDRDSSSSSGGSRLVKRHLTIESAYAVLDVHKLARDTAARCGGDGEVRAAASSLAAKESAIRSSVEVRDNAVRSLAGRRCSGHPQPPGGHPFSVSALLANS